MSISLIIPVKNESYYLDQLFHLLDLYPQEIKVYFCDGGCSDDSISKIKSYIDNKDNYYIYKDMNQSPSILSTVLAPIDFIQDKYVLIHPVDIDCRGILHSISEYSESDYYVFYKRYTPVHSLLQFQEFLLNKIRLGLLKDFVWTNSLLIRSDVLKNCSDLKNDFLEDLILSDHLKKNYKGVVVPSYIECSSRRYFSNGVVLSSFINICIMFLYRFLKVSPAKLKLIYYRLK